MNLLFVQLPKRSDAKLRVRRHFKQYWLLSRHHMGELTPTRAGNYGSTDPTTTQRAAARTRASNWISELHLKI